MTTSVDLGPTRLHLVVVGRQGAGKGVQCRRLADRYALDHISTGEVLREAVAEGTPLGRAVETYLVAGRLVPDDIVSGVVAERVAIADASGRGVVLDGFPRTVAQAERLEHLLAPGRIDLVIHIDVPRSVALERLQHRGRFDDTADAIGRRMSEHAREFGPLLDWLDARGVVVTVDGSGTVDDVAARTAAAVESHVLVS